MCEQEYHKPQKLNPKNDRKYLLNKQWAYKRKKKMILWQVFCDEY